MASLKDLLDKLWDDYAGLNPQAQAIQDLLRKRGETVVNDHIAFRTYDDPKIGIDALAKTFISFGYRPADRYNFPEKKLNAQHYEPPKAGLPKVFISELRVGEFSQAFSQIVKKLTEQVPADLPSRWDFPVSGRPWKVSYADYEELRVQSEYGAWMAAFGFRANHFTVDVGELASFSSLAQFNDFITQNGFELNASGGAIKGSPEDFLEQSSTLAAKVPVEFSDGSRVIPSCYYEFAKRYRTPDGRVFGGFIEKSANKIFESTNRRG